jgi:hypothetical protein
VLHQLAAKLIEIAERLGARPSGLKVNAMPQPPPFGDPRAQFLRRLDRMLGEINVLLTAVAVGLAVLDFTCFVALRVSAEIGRSQFGVRPAEQAANYIGGDLSSCRSRPMDGSAP